MNDDLAPLNARIDRTNELLQRMLAEVAKTPSTHAIFVDAGYLYAAAGRLVAGTEDRRAFDLDAEGLIEALIDRARNIFADSRLLRVYWYDGARVHLWGIEAPEGRNQAEPLLWEVDSQRTLDLDFFKPYVSRRTAPAAEATGLTRPAREDVRFVGAQIAAKWLASRGRESLVELLPGHPYLPGSVDQDLLVEAEGLLQYSLRGQADLRRALRDGFWEHLRAQY